MDLKRKTPVVRSSSTSEAKKNKSSAQEHKKISRSSAEFQAKLTFSSGFQPLKRRGVYVEKKSIKIPINVGIRSPVGRVSSPGVLPHRIRRPHKKRFLANILTLLSKATASTQCSGVNSNEELTIEKRRPKIKKKREEEIIYDPVTPPTARRKALASKTKKLHKRIDEIDSLIVLQSTKEIVQTPSNHSEFIPLLNRKAASTHIEPEHKDLAAPCPPTDRQDLNTTLAKPSHSKRVTLITNEKEAGFEDNRNEKDIYNFFVDILKTTLSACDVKQHTNAGPLYPNSSNVSLVIDEVVAEKLKVPKIKDESKAKIIENEPKDPYNELYMSPNNSMCYYSVMPYVTPQWVENFKPELSQQYKVELARKRKKQRINSNSFQYRAKPASNRPRSVPNKPMYKAPSMPVPQPKKKSLKLKVHNKRHFIDSLKQELFVQAGVVEKPSFFQALQTIAKNKKKQSVNFQTYRRPSDDNVCQLRSRKVLSAKSSLKKQPKTPDRRHIAVVPNTNQSNYSPYNRQAPTAIYETSSEESIASNYSLAVTSYDDIVV